MPDSDDLWCDGKAAANPLPGPGDYPGGPLVVERAQADFGRLASSLRFAEPTPTERRAGPWCPGYGKDGCCGFPDAVCLDPEINPDCGKPSNPKDVVGIRKAPMSTVPAAVLAEVGVAMLEGARKYGRHNYRAVGVRASVYYDACMRHVMRWWEGEDLDPDSGLTHVTKAIASLVVLRDAMMQAKLEDDRPPRSQASNNALDAQAALILDRYAGRPEPRHYTIRG